MTMLMLIFWILMLHGCVGKYQHFRGIHCVDQQGWSLTGYTFSISALKREEVCSFKMLVPTHKYTLYHSPDNHHEVNHLTDATSWRLTLSLCDKVANRAKFKAKRSCKKALEGTIPLTVQLCRDVINDTLLCVRVFNCWIIIRHKVALKNIKADQWIH
jgi:hypothetical protein